MKRTHFHRMFTSASRALSALLALLLLLSALTGCGGTGNTATTAGVTTTGAPATTTAAVTTTVPVTTVPVVTTAPEPVDPRIPTDALELTELGENVVLHTELQDTYLSGPYADATKYAVGKEELSRPLPIEFKWEDKGTGETSKFQYYNLRISESEDFTTELWEYTTTGTSFTVYNFKIGYRYYWQVEAVYRKATYVSPTATFTTAPDGPRNLYVSGVANVRDLGGHIYPNGATIRQGLIFRCGRLAANKSTQPVITDKGLTAVSQQLKWKTEIDLRRRGSTMKDSESGFAYDENGFSAIRGANYFPVPMETDDILGQNYAGIIEVFRILSDEANYPVAFHCSIGTDRTGMIAFFVEALCGASEEQLYRDYLLSNFANIGGSRNPSAIDGYLKAVRACPGETLADQTYFFLRNTVKVPGGYLTKTVKILKQK